MISIREVRWPVSCRKVAGPERWQPQGQFGHGVRHRDGVDGHVVQVDDGGRTFGRGPHERPCELVRGDPLQEVGRVDDQIGVQPGGAGNRPGGLFDHQREAVGRRRIGLALEEPGQEQVALLPTDELLVGLDLAGPREEPAGLELHQHRGHDQEFRQHGEVHVRPAGDLGQKGVDHVGQGDVEDVQLMAGDQLQEDVDGPLVDGGRDGGGHGAERYRRAGTGPVHPVPRAPAAAGQGVRWSTYGTCPLRNPAQRRPPPRELPGGHPQLGRRPGRARRFLLRGRPPRTDARHRSERPAGTHP